MNDSPAANDLYGQSCCPPGAATTVAGGKAAVCLGDDGVVHLGYAMGAVLDDADARSIMSVVNATCRGRRRPMLVDLQGLNAVGRGALWVFSIRSRASAMAIWGPSPVDSVLAQYFMRFYAMPCPVAFFARRAEATGWLRSMDPDPDGSAAPRPWLYSRRDGASRRRDLRAG